MTIDHSELPGIADERPTTKDVVGPHFAAAIASLEAQGARVVGWALLGNGAYRLNIRWPERTHSQ